MTIYDLLRELEARGADIRYFAIGQVPYGAYDRCVIAPSSNGWETYYTERGEKAMHRQFGTEGEACDHFLAWVSGMPELFQRNRDGA